MGSFCSTAPKWDRDLDGRLDPRVVQLKSRRQVAKAIRDVATASFAGNEEQAPEGVFDWLLGPEMRDGEGLFVPLARPPTPERRRTIHFALALMASARREPLTLGVVEDGEVIAVAVIDTKLGHSRLGSIADGLRFARGAIAALWAAGGLPSRTTRMYQRVESVQEIVETGHKEIVDQRHLYLEILATKPGHQGRGAGGALLRALSAMADRDGVPCYLETSGSRNVALYSRHGYSSRKSFATITTDGAPASETYDHEGGLHLMLHEPGALQAQARPKGVVVDS